MCDWIDCSSSRYSALNTVWTCGIFVRDSPSSQDCTVDGSDYAEVTF
jgi:hypothetical protein